MDDLVAELRTRSPNDIRAVISSLKKFDLPGALNLDELIRLVSL